MAKGNFKMLINQEKPVLVDFTASWCGPCKAMAPILDEVAKNVSGSAKVIKIDIDKNPQTANMYGIRSVPTLILFKDGKELWRHSGVLPAKQIEQKIKQHV